MLLYHRALAYLQMGRQTSALRDLSATVALNGDFVQARLRRAELYIKQGNARDALQDARVCLRLNPADAQMMELSSQADELLGLEQWVGEDVDHCADTAHLERLVELAPLSAAFRSLRGDCAHRAGDLEMAQIEYQRAVQINPNDLVAYPKAALMSIKLGETDKGVECVVFPPASRARAFAAAYPLFSLVRATECFSDASRRIQRTRRVVGCTSRCVKCKRPSSGPTRSKAEASGPISSRIWPLLSRT